MALGILTLIIGLSISAVAIYYSVLGLVAIFAAATVPIIVMGGVLEIGKLVTAVWLHRYWHRAKWWLKTYLATAVLVLMFITSMGIFGFLSKAHIEQTSAGTESIAQVERIEAEINRNKDIIERAETQIKKLETSGTGNDANVQTQIDKEQERIDNAYKRIQPAIDEQQAIIDSQSELWRSELAKIDKEITTLQGYIDNGETKKAQQMIGASADGIFGKNTAEKIGDWQDEKQKERLVLIQKIEEATNNPQAKAASAEIKRLRQSAENQVKQSNALIDRLRKQLGNEDKAANIDAEVDEQYLRIKNANAEIDTLTEQKYSLEGEYRKLEAEVGPIKYIAEFIYGDTADQSMLEEAVRWVIIVIIFVFDPLAVLLLIASQYTFEYARENKNPPSSGNDDGDSEQDPEPKDPKPSFTDEEWDEAHQMNYEYDRAKRIEENEPPSFEEEVKLKTFDEDAQEAADAFNEVFADELDKLDDETKVTSDLDAWNDWVDAANAEAEKEAEEQKLKIIPELQEVLDEGKKVKEWPETKNPFFFAEEAETVKKKTKPTEYYDKEGFDQVKKSYTQNEEQTEGTLWNRVKRSDSE